MGSRAKVLIVEDETGLLSVLTEKISREGYEVLNAKNGKAGLETALKEHPDLILLDVIMPIMDGMTMLQELRRDEWGKGAKVILLTNLNDPEKIQESIEAGAYEFLVKTDWKLSEVVEKVKTTLREK